MDKTTFFNDNDVKSVLDIVLCLSCLGGADPHSGRDIVSRACAPLVQIVISINDHLLASGLCPCGKAVIYSIVGVPSFVEVIPKFEPILQQTDTACRGLGERKSDSLR